eukprot:scaffold41521_cov63-Phaeocystis_antarctica.AAC.3
MGRVFARWARKRGTLSEPPSRCASRVRRTIAPSWQSERQALRLRPSARRGRPRRSGCRAVAPPRGPSLNRPVGRPGRPTGVVENSTCCLIGSVLREGRTTPAAWLGEFGMRASCSRSPRSTACESLATSWRPSVRGWTRRKRLSLAGEKSSSSNEPASGEPNMRGRAHRLLSGCARRCAGRRRSAGAASIASSIVL